MVVNCKACGKEIGESVKKCIHCGTDQRNFFMRHKITTLFLIFFVLSVIDRTAADIHNSNSKQTMTAQTAVTSSSNDTSKLSDSNNYSPDVSEQPIQLTTKQLDQDYNDNQFAADEKYKGKLLEVTGPIIVVDRDSDNNPYIHYAATDNNLVSVWCNFGESETSSLAKVDKNYKITVQGECSGIEKGLLSSNVMLNNCKVINISTEPIPENNNKSLLYRYYESQN